MRKSPASLLVNRADSRRPNVRAKPPRSTRRPIGPAPRAQLNYQFNLDIGDEGFLDEFACGGGASEGYHLATGRHVNFAVNHDAEAVAMHTMNHPHTRHFIQDVWHVDPLYLLGLLNGRKFGGAWFSPDCRHHSRASGGALRSTQVRGLSWILRKWAGRGGAIRVAPGKAGRVRRRGPACARVFFLENVSEIRTWGPLIAKRDPKTGRVVKRDGTVAAPGEHVPYRNQHLVPDKKRLGLYLKRLIRFLAEVGGVWEDRDIRASDIGAPTIRTRLFAVTRFDGKPAVWPKAAFGDPEHATFDSNKLKPWRTIAECLDFDRPCPSIFLSKKDARAMGLKRPLAKATLDRLAKGTERFVLNAAQPFIINFTHQGGDRTESVDRPAMTLTAANRGEKAFVSPVLAPFVTEHANGSQQRSFAADEPLRTQCAQVKGGHFAAVSTYLVPRYGERDGQEPRALSVERPAPAIVPTANGGSLAAVSLVGTAHGEFDKHGKKRGQGAHDVNAPLPTATASNDFAVTALHLTKFNTGAVGASLDQPAPTITANSFIKRPGGAPPVGLAAMSMVKMRGEPDTHGPTHELTEPAHTISAGGQHLGMMAAFLAQHNGGEVGHQSYGHSANEPASTISSKGSQQAVVGATLASNVVPFLPPELDAMARRVAAFLREHGVEFEGEYAMVRGYVIVDIGMRMLTPRELYRAQGFPESYIIDRGILEHEDGRREEIKLTKTAQIRMVGNSVSPVVAAALIRANLPEMIIEELAA